MSYLERRDISKVYGGGATEVHALQHVDLSGRLGVPGWPSGSHWLRQEHPADDRRWPRFSSDGVSHVTSRSDSGVASERRESTGASPLDTTTGQDSGVTPNRSV